MKKFIFVLLVVSLILSAAGCGDDSKEGNSSANSITDTSSNVAEKDECDQALELISQGKYKEAYDLLSSLKGNAKAEALLARFSKKPSNIKVTSPHSTDEYEFIYNSFGEYMKETVNGEVVVQNTYDINGKLLTSSETVNGETISSEYTYEGEKLTKITEKKGDALYCTVDYTYSGEKVSAETFSYAFGDVFKVEYTYDSNGREILEKTTLPNGKTESIAYTYTSDGQIATETFVDGDGNQEKVEYLYNSNGLIEKEITTKNGETITKNNTYSGKDLVKTVCTLQTSTKTSIVYAVEYTYENGKLAKEVNTSVDNVLTVEYSYNSDGDLVKRTRTKTLPDNTSETEIYEYSNYNYYFC